MLIRAGFDIRIECAQPTPTVTLMEIHKDRDGDLRSERKIETWPRLPMSIYTDSFGNTCQRFIAPAGELRLTYDALIADSGLPDRETEDATETPVELLPAEALIYLLGSRYCETDVLSEFAWRQFGKLAPGWPRVRAIFDYVNARLRFNYADARATRTAAEAHAERVGVCRDFAHLSITFCRCLNIPARYVNGYLGDIGVPKDPAPMDFSAWTEVYLGGRWHTFDARHNVPRIGRVVVARGRDATDVPLIHTFGPHKLRQFKIWTDEVPDDFEFARQQSQSLGGTPHIALA